MGLRAFCAGWRTVVFPLACRTAVFDAMFRAGIPLSRERMCGDSVSVRVREEDVRSAALVFASLGIEAEIGERRGLPAVLAFCRERPGIPVGLLLIALWLRFSGGLVWDIRIEGNTKTPDAVILAELAPSTWTGRSRGCRCGRCGPTACAGIGRIRARTSWQPRPG